MPDTDHRLMRKLKPKIAAENVENVEKFGCSDPMVICCFGNSNLPVVIISWIKELP